MKTICLLLLALTAVLQSSIARAGQDDSVQCSCYAYPDAELQAEILPCLLPDFSGDGLPVDGRARSKAAPIYIGGVLYKLSRDDFIPVYRDYQLDPLCDGNPVRVRRLVGYRAGIEVQGDYGQPLLFEISGRSGNKAMHFSAACGEFTASDRGDKYVISQVQTTNHSCSHMELAFAFHDGVAATDIELSVVIAEAF